MNFLSKILGKPPEEDYDEQGWDEYDSYDGYADEPELPAPEPRHVTTRPARENRVVEMRAARPDDRQVVAVAKIRSIDCAWTVCDRVKRGEIVICNTEYLTPDIRRRFQDVVSGSAYAIAGELKVVSQYIFVFAPHATKLTADEHDDEAYGVAGADDAVYY